MNTQPSKKLRKQTKKIERLLKQLQDREAAARGDFYKASTRVEDLPPELLKFRNYRAEGVGGVCECGGKKPGRVRIVLDIEPHDGVAVSVECRSDQFELRTGSVDVAAGHDDSSSRCVEAAATACEANVEGAADNSVGGVDGPGAPLAPGPLQKGTPAGSILQAIREGIDQFAARVGGQVTESKALGFFSASEVPLTPLPVPIMIPAGATRLEIRFSGEAES